MAGVFRFEDLRVWQAARDQCKRVGELLQRPAFKRDRRLSDQMNGSSYSVMFNISEGFRRGNDGEFDQFLRYAFASNGELKSAYYAAAGRTYLSVSELDTLVAFNDSISRMIRKLRATLDTRPRPNRSR